MPSARLLTCLVLVAVVLVGARGAGAAGASEDEKAEARRLYDEATAAFGVGNYAEAAEKYEGSFKVHPDAALLYNAAQAYRLAGNQPRALQLYRNFLRIYGDNPRAEDARNHVAALEKAIAEGGKPGTAPAPGTTAPAASAAAPAAPVAPLPAPGLNAPPPQPEQPPALLERQAAAPASAGDEASPSLVRRPWFWVAVGAAVLGGTVALLLVTRGDSYPDPTLGRL
jgi:tetratricopeptide (TPR) repeat protein